MQTRNTEVSEVTNRLKATQESAAAAAYHHGNMSGNTGCPWQQPQWLIQTQSPFLFHSLVKVNVVSGVRLFPKQIKLSVSCYVSWHAWLR